MSRCGQPAVIIAQCQPDCPETPEIELESINLSGIAILDSWDGLTGNFRGVASANSMLGVTLDNTNHNALLTISATAIADAFRAATTTQTGILETATDAEAIAKTATDKLITPSNFAAMSASTSFAGFIEIATNAEVLAGASGTLAVVPSSLASMNFPSFASLGSTTIPAGGQPGVFLDTGSTLEFSGTLSEKIVINSLTFQLDGGTALNFASGASTIQISGVDMSDDTLLGTGTGGAVDSFPITAFLSSYNTQGGYTPSSNVGVLRTWDCNTITLPQLAGALATLINDLKLYLSPAN